ncbi:arsenate reductase ArsC [Aminobacter sp. AP02]|uniref:arsenate reductase ArsC n=1 Tax=Aminobacter sp. AP02 TaxID=2135737 RepID=UPI000D6A97E8|nr:arsenate reductase ArsC [Aminobacter sp. AP02]PWK64610.1 protein tyrosine phosphatase [Aminobacter sp. AP02]
MSHKPYNVLFLCTGNSARSILAEGILRKDGAPNFNAFSAGSQAKGAVSPLALKVLESYGYPTDGFRSKTWDEFAVEGAPQMDFIFTVCDDAAGEACPIWPGHPANAHWGIEDPSNAEGSDLAKEAAFVTAFKYMRNRIGAFLALPLTSLDHMALTSHLEEIGKMAGATGKTPPGA